LGIVRADEFPCYLAQWIDHEYWRCGEATGVDVVGLHNRRIAGRVEHGERDSDATRDVVGACQIVDADGEDLRVLRLELVVFSLQITELRAAVRSPEATVEDKHDGFFVTELG